MVWRQRAIDRTLLHRASCDSSPTKTQRKADNVKNGLAAINDCKLYVTERLLAPSLIPAFQSVKTKTFETCSNGHGQHSKHFFLWNVVGYVLSLLPLFSSSSSLDASRLPFLKQCWLEGNLVQSYKNSSLTLM